MHRHEPRNPRHSSLNHLFSLRGFALILLLAGFLASPFSACAAPVRLVILHTGDIHGHMSPQPDPTAASEPKPLVGGYAALANVIAQERLAALKSGGIALYMDGGDTFQGTPVVDETKGLCMIAAMNHLKTFAATIGNHDFDYGVAGLASAAAGARHPLLACNVFDEKTGRLLPFLKPYIRFPFKGTEFAFIGVLSPDTARISLAENVEGVEFRDPVPILSELIPRLRRQGVDFVILLTHIGLDEDKKLADAVPDIDLILGSHSHTPMTEPEFSEQHLVPIIHNAFDNRVVGKITLDLEWWRTVIRYEPISMYIASYSENPEMKRLVAGYQDEIDAKMSVVVGTSTVDLVRGVIGGDSPEGSFIADAMRHVAGADFAVTNIGGVRYPVWKGPVTKNDLFLLQPFLNYVDVVTMTGEQVVDLMAKSLSVPFSPVNDADNLFAKENFKLRASGMKREFQGDYGYLIPSNLKVTFDPHRPPLKRIVEITDDSGAKLDPKRLYKVALNSYMSTGGDGYTYLKTMKRTPTGILVRDAIERYIASTGGIHAIPPVRMNNTALTIEPLQ